jgi:hypothetical protein
MLLKLLKYEFKSTYLKFLSAFAVYIVMSAVLLTFLKDHVWLTLFLISAGIIGLFVITFLELFQRYNANLYGSEGYLMFTLPVSSKKLLASKLISAFVWIAALEIVAVAAVFAMACAYGDIKSISKVFEAIWKVRGELPPYIASIVVAVIATAVAICFSITVSKLPLWRKAGVVMGFVTYFAVNVIQSIPAYLFGQITAKTTLTSGGRSQVLFDLAPTGQNTMSFVWVEIGYTLLLCVGIFFATAALMDKKTSLR